jgi:hypothetical protein
LDDVTPATHRGLQGREQGDAADRLSISSGTTTASSSSSSSSSPPSMDGTGSVPLHWDLGADSDNERDIADNGNNSDYNSDYESNINNKKRKYSEISKETYDTLLSLVLEREGKGFKKSLILSLKSGVCSTI